MGYDKPKGQALRAARVAVRVAHEADKALTCVRLENFAPDTIAADFFLKGVRTNGSQQLCGANPVLDSLEAERNDLIEASKKGIAALDKAVTELKAALKGSRRCHACNGRSGLGRSGSCHDPWRDCDVCSGQGRIYRKG